MKENQLETIGNKIFDLLEGQNTAFAKEVLTSVMNGIDSKSTLSKAL